MQHRLRVAVNFAVTTDHSSDKAVWMLRSLCASRGVVGALCAAALSVRVAEVPHTSLLCGCTIDAALRLKSNSTSTANRAKSGLVRRPSG